MFSIDYKKDKIIQYTSGKAINNFNMQFRDPFWPMKII